MEPEMYFKIIQLCGGKKEDCQNLSLTYKTSNMV